MEEKWVVKIISNLKIWLMKIHTYSIHIIILINTRSLNHEIEKETRQDKIFSEINFQSVICNKYNKLLLKRNEQVHGIFSYNNVT